MADDAGTLLAALRDVSEGCHPREREAFTLLSELVLDGWQVVGTKPGWYYQLAKPPHQTVVPINPYASDFRLLMDAALRQAAS